MPRSDFMTRSSVLSIDLCRGLGISPLRNNHLAELSQADLGPTFAQDFFCVFAESLELFFVKICAHSERSRNLMAGIFFMATSRFH